MLNLLIFITIQAHAIELPPVTVPAPKDFADVELPEPPAGERDLSRRLQQLPNVSTASGSNRPRFVQIRGVGETSQFEHSQVNSIGLFYEGIDLSEEASVVPWLGREFTRAAYGPQSIDWGGKALGGALSVRSCLTADCTPHLWQAEAGSYRTYGLSGGSLWKGEDLAGMIAAGGRVSDGYYRNAYLDKPTGKRDEMEAVVGLEYELGSWRVRQHHLFARHRNGYDAWNFTPSFETTSDHPGADNHQVSGHSLQYAYPLHGGRLRGLTSVTLVQQLESYDEDWSNNDYWNSLPGYNDDYNYFASFGRERLKLHQKLAWESDRGFTLGAHFYLFDEQQIQRSFKDENLRRETKPRFTSRHLAAWARKTWTDGGWRWNLGLRLENQRTELTGVDPSGARKVPLLWGAEAGVTRQWQPDLFTDVTLARGFRGAGFNSGPGIGADRVSFDPEQIYSAQASVRGEGKNPWAVRVFHQWQFHQQTRSSFQSDPMDPNTFTYFTGNAAGSRSFGVEAVGVRRQGWLTLSGSAGWLKSQYTSYELAGQSLNGRALPQAPEWTYSARAEWGPQKWSLFFESSGRAPYYHSAEHGGQTKAYTIEDVGVNVRHGNWRTQAWVSNVFDRRYAVRGYHFANEPPAWIPKLYEQLGPPRTYGLRLIYEM